MTSSQNWRQFYSNCTKFTKRDGASSTLLHFLLKLLNANYELRLLITIVILLLILLFPPKLHYPFIHLSTSSNSSSSSAISNQTSLAQWQSSGGNARQRAEDQIAADYNWSLSDSYSLWSSSSFKS